MATNETRDHLRAAIEDLIRSLPAHHLRGAMDIVRAAGASSRRHRSRRAASRRSGTHPAPTPARALSQWLVAFVIVIGLSGLSACAPSALPTVTPTANACDVAAYRDTIRPILTEWDDAVTLANQTPRIQLADQIAKLQEIRRRAADVDGGCKALRDAHEYATFAMQKQIDAFLAFLAEKSDNSVTELDDAATNLWNIYTEMLDKVP